MKKVVEMKVPEAVDLKEKIIELAIGNKSWIYLSNGLFKRLDKDSHHSSEFALEGRGRIFYQSEEDTRPFHVECDIVWNRVTVIPERKVHISSDPEVIYFLS